MPLITARQVGSEFIGTQSGWPSISGTETLLPVNLANGSTASQAFTSAVTSGIATALQTLPTYGNTILNFKTAATTTSLTTAPDATPGANRLCIVAIHNATGSGTANQPSITAGCGLTWNLLGTQTFGSRRLTLYSAYGASPTSANFTFDFAAQSQTRIYVWGYDFINAALTESGSKSAASLTSSTGSTTVAITPSASATASRNFIFFACRNSSATPTNTTDHYLAANSTGQGDYMSTNGTGSFTWSTTAGNAIAGLALYPSVDQSTNYKTYMCSSGSTPAQLQHGTIDIGITVPRTFSGTPTESYTTAGVFFWSPESVAVDSNDTGYYAYATASASKVNNVTIATYTISIQYRASGSTTTLSSVSFTEDLSNGVRQAGEIWNFKLNLAKVNSTQSKITLHYSLPASSSQVAISGSIDSGLINTPGSNFAFGIQQFYASNNNNGSQGIDYFRLSDTTSFVKNVRAQAVNRSVVW